ncbi:Sds3-like-domain-containing protein [Podospora didyma]|uniref:Sds3-like-domain-containing protein n=1 Tax=Podospora didyma TaxID=330526 RepID=A0AAE0U8Q3_9PEZI|nr:Sds3-like-domain-containing protein [Podospora didyma]
MATGDTAPLLARSSPPSPLHARSPSNLSSPLSDVEDKDAEHGDADMDAMHALDFRRRGTPEQVARGDGHSDADSESDDESKLSEMDVNDSEAETERLYDTPPKSTESRDILNIVGDVGNRQFIDRRDRVFERSPSKLQQQLQATLDARDAASDNNYLSEGEEEDDDDVSMASRASSEHAPEPGVPNAQRSPYQHKKPPEVIPSTESTISETISQESLESRKRKRLSLAEQSESEQPLRKRTGSIAPPEVDFSADDTVVLDDERTSTNPQSGNHTAEEDNIEEPETAVQHKEVPTESIEEDTTEGGRSRKPKRNAAKKRKSKSPEKGSGQVTEDAQDSALEDMEGPAAEVPTPRIEDGNADDADEDVVAHKEEELERKKAAWEELTAIEKQFNSFRDRLYQERLDQLEQEEASLTAETPSHPEYLAMLQCLEERRQERIRVSTLELQFRMSVLNGRAVAERSQVMSQFYQSIRESREKVLEELGQEWYDIQQERRRFANTIPDYGIRFPTAKTQTVKSAVAYNKEVSILSGFAKHVGFPAAPPINGASDDQLESDLEAISRTREPVHMPTSIPPAVFHPEFTSGLPFGRDLGPAGEQFIEQTPWANPNHPSHHIQRQNSHQDTSIHTTYAGPSLGHRIHSHQPGNIFPPSNPPTMNGEPPLQMQKNHLPAHETIKASKFGPDHPMKRESIAQVS